MNERPDEPDWDAPLALRITPRALINAVFWSATSAHTGHESCIDPKLVLGEIRSVDDATGNWCRIVEQEFFEEEQEDVVWHDWSVEVRLEDVYVIGHWQLPVSAAPMEWEWQAQAAEEAFEKACVLFGARSRRTVAIVEPPSPDSPPADVKRH
ncbi:MAG: hypothetical protein P8106_04895 [Gammaproteobacteria bacterium]|jgi:hypothetical protein